MDTKSNMRFFTFRQNNPGGKFDPAMPLRLVVDARDAEHANERAESLGVYFDGCRDGRDCSCCGDRWTPCSPIWDLGDAAPDLSVDSFDRIYVEAGRVPSAVHVFYLDGREVCV